MKREMVNENGHNELSDRPGRIEESEVKKAKFQIVKLDRFSSGDNGWWCG